MMTEPFRHFGHFIWNLFFPRRNHSRWARISSLSRLHDHTQTQYTQDSSARGIDSSQRPPPDNKQRSQAQTSKPPAGNKQPQTYALHRAANGISEMENYGLIKTLFSFVYQTSTCLFGRHKVGEREGEE